MILLLILFCVLWLTRYYINQIINMITLFYYLYQSYHIINNEKEVDQFIINKIKDCINKTGIFTIKMTQWLHNRFKLLIDKKNLHSFLENFDSYYENCPTHEFNFTKQLFLNDFGKDIEEILIIENKPIASGSIGQVYKGIYKENNRKVAIKCVHPNINKQIFIPKYSCIIVNFLLKYIPFLQKYQIPLDLYGFFDFLEKQIDLSEEVRNMKKMREKFKDNSIIVIPEPLFYSKNIIVMSYEEGEFFEDIQISDYKKSKIVTAFKLFMRSSLLTKNFMHGDLHDGNWKVKSHPNIKNMYQIIIYDLGICLDIDNDFINNFMDYFDEKNIPKIVDSILKNGVHSMPQNIKNNLQENIDELVSKFEQKFDLTRIDTNQIFQILLPSITEKKIILKNIFLNLLITIMITQNHIRNYTETTTMYTGDENRKIRDNNMYKLQYPSMISFCKTYSCFNDHCQYMIKKLEENNSGNDLFDGVEDKLNFYDSDNGFEKINLDFEISSEDEEEENNNESVEEEYSSDDNGKENSSEDEEEKSSSEGESKNGD